MKKAELKNGEDYYAASTTYQYGVKHVRIVDNEMYASISLRNRQAPAKVKYASKAFVAAHLAVSVCAAYPDHTTKAELSACNEAYSAIVTKLADEWYEADPKRAFTKSNYGSRWDPAGVLVQYIDKDGEVKKGYGTVPRREFRSTWAEHLAQVKFNDEARVRNAATKAKNDADKVAAKAALRVTLIELGARLGENDYAGADIDLPNGTTMNIPLYRENVTLAWVDFVALLKLAKDASSSVDAEYLAQKGVS